MGCFSLCSSKKPREEAMWRSIEHESLVSIPQCRVELVDGGSAVEVGSGEMRVTRIWDGGVCVATVIRVGDQLTWPLTKDEPVVKVGPLSYLFTLPITDGHPLSYGVSFPHHCAPALAHLDRFLPHNSCFSGLAGPAPNTGAVDWKEFAPRVEDYNSVLARAIAGGTGHIVKGIFKCSNAYANQVQKGGQAALSRDVPKPEAGAANNTALNKSLKRVRKVSKMTEKLSKGVLEGVGIATGAVVGPIVKSQAGKSFLAMLPGEVLLASLDALNKILDAAEVAEKQALSATTTAATRMVSSRFGDNAGEATGDVLATAGHCAGTAWNVFKIRKALNPASSLSTGVLKNAAKSTTKL